MSEPRVAVVGAGVVGLACAWELRRRGADVVVLERAGVGGGVSRGNTGWVSPSLTYPLPAPGMLREGLRQLLTGGDAFVLRPRLDPAFVRWLWSFRRNCSSARFDTGIRALLALNRRTLELFDAYRDAGVAFEMHTAGLVVAALARRPTRSGQSGTVRARPRGGPRNTTWDKPCTAHPATAAHAPLAPQARQSGKGQHRKARRRSSRPSSTLAPVPAGDSISGTALPVRRASSSAHRLRPCARPGRTEQCIGVSNRRFQLCSRGPKASQPPPFARVSSEERHLRRPRSRLRCARRERGQRLESRSCPQP